MPSASRLSDAKIASSVFWKYFFSQRKISRLSMRLFGSVTMYITPFFVVNLDGSSL